MPAHSVVTVQQPQPLQHLQFSAVQPSAAPPPPAQPLSHLLRHLQSHLTVTHPGATLMPTREGGKIPLFPHKVKGGVPQYDAARFLATGAAQCAPPNGCCMILPLGLIAADVDDPVTAADLVARFPEFDRTVTCATAKGFHYYFIRTPTCTFMDGARQAGADLPIDIKMQTNTGIGDILWLRAPVSALRVARPL